MPQAQVINFGEDPYANAMGNFAKNFLGTINERSAQRRNDDLFRRISQNYGEDADPEMFLRDVIEAEGLDQEYKRDKIKDITEWAKLSTKANKNNYEQAKLDQRAAELLVREETNRIAGERVDNEKRKIDLTDASNAGKANKQVSDYASKTLKDSNVTLPAHDVADLKSFMEQLVTDKESPMTVSDAFRHAYNYIEARREKLENVQITPRPAKWLGQSSPQEIETSMEKAFQELKALHDEDGVENQGELRALAKKAGWQPDEITAMLKKIFQQAGKSLRGAPVNGNTPQESAQIPFQEQGKAAQVAGVDDILFGE